MAGGYAVVYDRVVKRLRILALAVSLSVAGACGGAEKPKPPEAPKPVPTATKPAFQELRFYQAGAHLYTLRDDGVVVAVQKKAGIATLKPNMTLEVSNGHAATLSDTGAIVIDGTTSEYRINSDNTMVVPGGGVVSLLADGTIGGLRVDSEPLRIEGATTSESVRAAMFLLALITMPAVGKDAPVCGDGSAVTCDMEVTACAEGQVRRVVAGCYEECVDATTCEPPEDGTKIDKDKPAPAKKKKKKRRKPARRR